MISFTIPSWPTTNVARFAYPSAGIVPPYCFETVPPSSERSGNWSFCSCWNFRWASTVSVEMPTTWPPFFDSSAYRSRYAWTSRVQPGVPAFT
jgi:hypothetical protein